MDWIFKLAGFETIVVDLARGERFREAVRLNDACILDAGCRVTPASETLQKSSQEWVKSQLFFPGRPEETQAKLGGGPGIFVYNSSELPNRRLVTFVKAAAEKLRIPLQLDLVQGYGDDSAEIQKSNGGVPTVCLVVPVRYTHAHNGIMNRQDFDQMVELMVELLRNLDAPTVARLRSFADQ